MYIEYSQCPLSRNIYVNANTIWNVVMWCHCADLLFVFALSAIATCRLHGEFFLLAVAVHVVLGFV